MRGSSTVVNLDPGGALINGIFIVSLWSAFNFQLKACGCLGFSHRKAVPQSMEPQSDYTRPAAPSCRGRDSDRQVGSDWEVELGK
jgi:hypothetical protein